MSSDGYRLRICMPGEAQCRQRQDAVLVIVAPHEQPLCVVEAPLQHPQFGQRGAHLPFGTRSRVHGPAGREAQGHLGFVPAADVAEDEPEVRAAVGVEERRAFVDAQSEMPVRRAGPLIGSAQVTDSCA